MRPLFVMSNKCIRVVYLFGLAKGQKYSSSDYW